MRTEDAPFNGLSCAEAERLALLIEELGEALQVAGKILRHGWTPIDYSVDPPVSYNNRTHLAVELAQVTSAIGLMAHSRDIQEAVFEKEVLQRPAKLRPYLHHQNAPEVL